MSSLPVSDQATLLLAQGFALQTVMNVITKGRGGKALTQAEVKNIKQIAQSAKPTVNTVPGTAYNQQAIKQLNNCQLPGTSTGGKTGVPREMAPSSNPDTMAKYFVEQYAKSKNQKLPTPIPKGKAQVYELSDGTTISYRPGGAASSSTSPTTATVEINNKASINNLNKDKQLKLKFPVKSEVKK